MLFMRLSSMEAFNYGCQSFNTILIYFLHSFFCFHVINDIMNQYNLMSIYGVEICMEKLVIHNHYKEQNKEKREQDVLQIILKMIKRKNS